MAHVRSQIRDAAATALSSVGPTVYKSRAYAVGSGNAAVLCVYTDVERVEAAIGTGNYHRSLSLRVEVVAGGRTDTLDDTLDTYASSIETALFGSKLSGLVKNIVLSDTETDLEVPDGADQVIGIVRLTFNVTYHTSGADPDTAI